MTLQQSATPSTVAGALNKPDDGRTRDCSVGPVLAKDPRTGDELLVVRVVEGDGRYDRIAVRKKSHVELLPCRFAEVSDVYLRKLGDVPRAAAFFSTPGESFAAVRWVRNAPEREIVTLGFTSRGAEQEGYVDQDFFEDHLLIVGLETGSCSDDVITSEKGPKHPAPGGPLVNPPPSWWRSGARIRAREDGTITVR